MEVEVENNKEEKKLIMRNTKKVGRGIICITKTLAIT